LLPLTCNLTFYRAEQGDGVWVEDDGGLTEIYFEEQERDLAKKRVVLFDPGRNMHVILTETMSLLRVSAQFDS
jgi:hypothetical protein